MLMRTVQFQLMSFKLGRVIALSGIVSKLREMSRLPSNSRILEIGCGNGVGSHLVDKHFSPSEMIATDLDERLVRAARGNNPGGLDIAFEVGDATKLKYDDNEFDAVIDLNVMHHIPNWRDGLNEMKRVIRPGGEFIVKDLSIETFETLVGRIARKVVHHPYNDMFRELEFVDYLKAIEFRVSYYESLRSWDRTSYFLLIAENT
jgi:ubiquinone/menaquinone biosynthesis C-methylase UbiE